MKIIIFLNTNPNGLGIKLIKADEDLIKNN